MKISRINDLLGRFPALKRTLVRLIARIPLLDMRLRKAAHEARHGRSQMKVDAANLPEEALFLHARLARSEARKPGP